jgi:hypothetical protein
VLGAVIVAIGALWWAGLREGTPWGDDWAMYVRHAKNLATGRAYADAPLIPNPYFPTYAPHTYPPGFPAMLVPIYLLFGVDIALLKTPVVVSFVLSLGVAAVYYRTRLSTVAALLLVLAVGLDPVNWELKDYILADFPFMLAILVCAWAIDAYYTASAGRGRHWIAIGAAIYAAYSIRTLGLLFLPALLAYELLTRRRIGTRFWIVAGTFVVLAAAEAVTLRWDTSYLTMVTHYGRMGAGGVWSDVVARAAHYRRASWDLWTMGRPPTTWFPLYADGLLVLGGAGLVRRMATRLSPVELFVLGYLVTIFLFPGYQGVRFLSPLLPFFFAYVLGVVDAVRRPLKLPFARSESSLKLPFARSGSSLRYAAFAIVLAPLALSYASFYGAARWDGIADGAHTPAARALFGYVRDRTPADAVFVVGKPRAFSLYTDRPAAVYHEGGTEDEWVAFMKRIGTRYVVTGMARVDRFDEWVRRDVAHFRLVYESGGLGLFEARL